MTETVAATRGQLQIGRYVVEAKLAEGGMAYTWLCRLHGAKGFTKTYVVKTLKPTCRAQPFLTMFLDEARLGSRIEHPNVCRIVELGDSNGLPFLVQEFIDGPTLKQITTREAARRLFDVPLGVQIIADIAGALHAVHNLTDDHGRRLNVVHRDVSPSNILVSRQGVPKLIDFGVARFDDRETQTEVGVLKGKLRYMAPEIVRGSPPSHQSDIYSLGICLLSACGATGLGREGGIFHLTDLEHVSIEPTLKGIIADCVRPDPRDRWPTGTHLEQALEGWLDAHGGRLGPAEIGERIGEMFPQGPPEWRSEELTVALVKSELSSGLMIRPVPGSGMRRWLPVAAVLVATAATLLALTVTLTVLAIGNRPNHQPSDRVEAAFSRAEGAVEAGRIDEANAALAEISGVTLDAAGQARHLEINQQLLLLRVTRIRKLAEADPDVALLSARALAESHPHPELDALIASLEGAGVDAAPAPAPTLVTSPTPAPTAGPRPTDPAVPVPGEPDDLFGERIGRPPSSP